MAIRQLFDATAAGSSLSKLLWPSTFTVTLPDAMSGKSAAIQNATSATVGGVVAVSPHWNGVLLDFCAVGAADQSLVVEIGSFDKTGTLARVLASVTLKSITTSGTTTANINPLTGDATASTTWRLFDLVTLTAKAQLGQVATNVGGSEDDTPSQLYLSADEANFYYVMITSIASLTRVFCGYKGIPVQSR